MLYSAAPFTLPPEIEPPIRTTPFTSGTIEGSLRTAIAILVSGPTGIIVISFGYLWTRSMIRSGPKRLSPWHLLGGTSAPPSPFAPFQ